jgi:hypothetical protein
VWRCGNPGDAEGKYGTLSLITLGENPPSPLEEKEEGCERILARIKKSAVISFFQLFDSLP